MQLEGPTTPVNASDHLNSDAISLALPLHVPMAVQTYYDTICKNQPLARRNFIINDLRLVRGPDSQRKHDYVVAKVKHLRGHDISDRLEYLVIGRSLYSPMGSFSSSRAKYIVSQCRTADGDRGGTLTPRKLTFNTSSDSNVRKLCLLEELFRLVTIISKNSHLYSTDIDASFWFAATIMETAQAIFPSYDDESGWFERTFLMSKFYKPTSECGRQIVAAYRADKKENPIPTLSSTGSQSVVSNSASGNEYTQQLDETDYGRLGKRREER